MRRGNLGMRQPGHSTFQGGHVHAFVVQRMMTAVLESLL